MRTVKIKRMDCLMDKFKKRPYILKNAIQYYAWGTKNKHAFIPRLFDIESEPDKPYAELWIGIHPNAPSLVEYNQEIIPLNQFISKYPKEILGSQCAAKFNNQLPFLLKVLSAEEALSIQAHPNKSQAEILHAKDKKNYPDSNHKPEVAVALDSFTALVGFRVYEEWVEMLHEYPEMKRFLGKDFLDQTLVTPEQKHSWQRELYKTLMKNAAGNSQLLSETLNDLDKRLQQSAFQLTEQQQLFISLHKVYNDDVGLYSIFLLNLVHLKKGQAFFIKAGIPHSYIKGNIIECMSNSDNVVRAGLTPKFKDISTLLDILVYESGPVEILEDRDTLQEFIYKTPMSEFEVSRILLDKKEVYNHKCKTIEILLPINGNGLLFWENSSSSILYTKGEVLLVPASLNEYQLDPQEDSEIFKVSIPVI